MIIQQAMFTATHVLVVMPPGDVLKTVYGKAGDAHQQLIQRHSQERYTCVGLEGRRTDMPWLSCAPGAWRTTIITQGRTLVYLGSKTPTSAAVPPQDAYSTVKDIRAELAWQGAEAAAGLAVVAAWRRRAGLEAMAQLLAGLSAAAAARAAIM